MCLIYSVISDAANDKKVPYEFVGGFRFQRPGKEERVAVIGDIIVEVFERFRKNRGFYPEKLVIFRNGCSEGQFKMLITTEVPFVSMALNNLEIQCPLTVIVPNRMHNIRFMPVDARPGQPPPGQFSLAIKHP